MRIIAGKYRRRKLLTNEGMTTRPITSRVKEMLFQRIGDEVRGKKIADIFAGTGTMGLEAVSRGAASVVFFEKDRKAVELLNENIKHIKMDEPHLCWKTDILRSSFCPKGVDHLYPYDVIFFDPPYVMVKDIKPGGALYKSLERLASDRCSSENALLVFRTPNRADFEMPPAWKFDRTYDLSTMKVHLYDKQAVEAEESHPENDSGELENIQQESEE